MLYAHHIVDSVARMDVENGVLNSHCFIYLVPGFQKCRLVPNLLNIIGQNRLLNEPSD